MRYNSSRIRWRRQAPAHGVARAFGAELDLGSFPVSLNRLYTSLLAITIQLTQSEVVLMITLSFVSHWFRSGIRGALGLQCSLAGNLIVTMLASSAFAGEFPPVSQLPKVAGFPDPLTMFDGTRVTTKEQWFTKRRPELKALFEHYEYGGLPPKPARIEFNVVASYSDFLGGKATLKLVTISFGDPTAPHIELMLVVPNGAKARLPVFLGLNWIGNQSITDDGRVPVTHSSGHIEGLDDKEIGLVKGHATESSRGIDKHFWPLPNIIDRGYAVATFCKGDVDSDLPNVSDGVYAWLARQHGEKTPPKARHRGSIAAWAWGLQRGVDYLIEDKDIDPTRIALLGHSRNGKAAILAAAFDERVALVIPHQAGQGGTSPARNTSGETVREINRDFPYWFNAEFKKFNRRPDRLPFDHHALIALVAPRPVLLSNASEDEEANPKGQFQMLSLASRVYEFLGEPGLSANSMPPMGELVKSRLGYFMRPGKHDVVDQDWKAFLDFADAQMPPKVDASLRN